MSDKIKRYWGWIVILCAMIAGSSNLMAMWQAPKAIEKLTEQTTQTTKSVEDVATKINERDAKYQAQFDLLARWVEQTETIATGEFG